MVDSRHAMMRHDAHTNRMLTEVETAFAEGGYPGIARRWGAHVHRTDDEVWVEIGIFAPRAEGRQAYLEILRPPRSRHGEHRLERVEFPVSFVGGTAWVALKDLPVGDRYEMGALYWLRFRNEDDEWVIARDALASSLPWGLEGPAEIYDTHDLHRHRRDADWLAAHEKVPRVSPPTQLMELHVNTATSDGTIAGLKDRLQRLARKVELEEELEVADKAWLGYDAFQIMPLHSMIVPEAGPRAWETVGHDEEALDVVTRLPAISNWGYDIVVGGSAAPEASLLSSGRPHELVELIETLHTFPGGGMKVVLDVVYGHADNQALNLVEPDLLAGPNMYGQDIAFRNPAVRAMVVELLQRLGSYGFDGIRVDGAQDFKYWTYEDGVVHDDALLDEMSLVRFEAAGANYSPWMVFEDGRPWPDEDWELSSTYRAVIEHQTHDPDVFQWGPMTFAHNTPALYTFWIKKWWRLREITERGREWITGCANHDTLRRGAQVDINEQINTALGITLPDIFEHAYDHPAAMTMFHGFLPGVPMDFIQANLRTPWAFIRNTDRRYALKVAAEEAGVFDWLCRPSDYGRAFPKLQARGLETREQARRLWKVVERLVTYMSDADIAAMLEAGGLGSFEPHELGDLARDFMEDLHLHCCVEGPSTKPVPENVENHLLARRFRKARPWLRENFLEQDSLRHRLPVDGTVLAIGRRSAPQSDETLLYLGVLEGRPAEVDLDTLPEAEGGGWSPAILAGDVHMDGSHVHIGTASAVLLTRGTPQS